MGWRDCDCHNCGSKDKSNFSKAPWDTNSHCELTVALWILHCIFNFRKARLFFSKKKRNFHLLLVMNTTAVVNVAMVKKYNKISFKDDSLMRHFIVTPKYRGVFIKFDTADYPHMFWAREEALKALFVQLKPLAGDWSHLWSDVWSLLGCSCTFWPGHSLERLRLNVEVLFVRHMGAGRGTKLQVCIRSEGGKRVVAERASNLEFIGASSSTATASSSWSPRHEMYDKVISCLHLPHTDREAFQIRLQPSTLVWHPVDGSHLDEMRSGAHETLQSTMMLGGSSLCECPTSSDTTGWVSLGGGRGSGTWASTDGRTRFRSLCVMCT